MKILKSAQNLANLFILAPYPSITIIYAVSYCDLDKIHWMVQITLCLVSGHLDTWYKKTILHESFIRRKVRVICVYSRSMVSPHIQFNWLSFTPQFPLLNFLCFLYILFDGLCHANAKLVILANDNLIKAENDPFIWFHETTSTTSTINRR